MNPPALDTGLIEKARETLQGHIHVTPVVRHALLSERLGARVFLKLENLQRGGSFKIRGAMTFIESLHRTGYRGPLVAASAGNHAQGVALAAREFEMPACIFMPEGAVQDKIDSTRSFGAEVVQRGSNLDETFTEALAFCRDEGAQFVHPFEHPLIMAGQGTVGLEIAEQCPEARTIVVPVGGGGLAAGVATALKARNPNCHVVGVQAEVCSGMAQSWLQGHLVTPPFQKSLADGISVKRPSAAMLEILGRVLDDMVTVSEEAIAEAMLFLILRGKTLAEGAGAAALAALLEDKVSIHGRTVLALVSGGNVDPKRIVDLMERRG